MENNLTVFISYSWDSEAHKEWVLNLANYLFGNGINVLLDQYELSAGKDLQYFMESGVEKADKVLLILTPNYKIKSDERQGGTGFEYSMISQELYSLQHNNKKFIPILREGSLHNSAPVYLKSKVYLDMGQNTNFEVQAFKLLRELYEKPEITKPSIGNAPNFEKPEIDPVILAAQRLGEEERLQNDILRLLESEKGFEMAESEVERLFQKAETKALEYSNKTRFEFISERLQNTFKIVISLRQFKTSAEWQKGWSANLRDANLRLEKFEDPHNSYRYSNHRIMNFGTSDNQTTFKPDINEQKQIVWRNLEGALLTSDDIVSKMFSDLMDLLRQEVDEKKKR